MRRIAPFALALLLLLLMPLALVAAPQSLGVQSPAGAAEAVQTNLNFVWVLVATMLVFLMQAGFALLETGFTRSKNAVNIIMKNIMDVSVGGLAFFAVGFGLMFGTGLLGIIGTDGFFLRGIADDPWTLSFFLFQAVFAATAATIVSGAVAERIKFSGYLILTIAITGLIYPVFGAWAWGGLFNGNGWLEALGFIDFAGSTVVHSVGAWAALAGALVIGPRVGKYGIDGRPRHIPGHNLPLAALGIFILWFGWFGFNAGSTTEGTTGVALIALNTFLSSIAAATAAMVISWIKKGKPDAPLTMNGVLGGLVGITAGCANLTPTFALIAGSVAGVIVVYASEFLERYVDDAVGAIAVHGVCGAWGTIAAGLFDSAGMFNLGTVGVQMLGVSVAFLWAFPTSYIVCRLLDNRLGLRVNGDLETMGLDLYEHDYRAYPEFIPTDELSPAEV